MLEEKKRGGQAETFFLLVVYFINPPRKTLGFSPRDRRGVPTWGRG